LHAFAVISRILEFLNIFLNNFFDKSGRANHFAIAIQASMFGIALRQKGLRAFAVNAVIKPNGTF
jgi:hypothetical protein